jgi:hypothetical protein
MHLSQLPNRVKIYHSWFMRGFKLRSLALHYSRTYTVLDVTIGLNNIEDL